MDLLCLDLFGPESDCAFYETPDTTTSWYQEWEVPCRKCRPRPTKPCWRCRLVLRIKNHNSNSLLSPQYCETEPGFRSAVRGAEGLQLLGLTKLTLLSPTRIDNTLDDGFSEILDALTYEDRYWYEHELGRKHEDADASRSRKLGQEQYLEDEIFIHISMRAKEPEVQIMKYCLRHVLKKTETFKPYYKLVYYGIGLGGVHALSYGPGTFLDQSSRHSDGPASRVWTRFTSSILWGYRQGTRFLGFDPERQRALNQLD
ncbi:hypothetical protein JX266_013081 [Neoarthrinium moseri]|nr:hypothetical protein JX266_013081 [Neoarthrinium moseri]